MSVVKKYAELVKRVREIMPDASFDMDNEGQIVIYTDLQRLDDDSLVEWCDESWEESEGWDSSDWCS